MKENLSKYFEKETAPKSILALLKLFDKYKSLKAYEKQIEKLKVIKLHWLMQQKRIFCRMSTQKVYLIKMKKRLKN